ncbi:MAG: YkgJ family cysteine cluster protein [Planctomycetota bacterium]
MATSASRDDVLRELERLHEKIDRKEQGLARRARLMCRRGCAACCIDGITVFEIEAERIRRHHARLLSQGIPHAEGACALLSHDGACRVYDERPYVCRTQGLPLQWFEELSTGEVREQRDICPLNAAGVELDSLRTEDLWMIGPFELRLAELQERFSGGPLTRVTLRSLFVMEPV